MQLTMSAYIPHVLQFAAYLKVNWVYLHQKDCVLDNTAHISDFWVKNSGHLHQFSEFGPVTAACKLNNRGGRVSARGELFFPKQGDLNAKEKKWRKGPSSCVCIHGHIGWCLTI